MPATLQAITRKSESQKESRSTAPATEPSKPGQTPNAANSQLSQEAPTRGLLLIKLDHDQHNEQCTLRGWESCVSQHGAPPQLLGERTFGNAPSTLNCRTSIRSRPLTRRRFWADDPPRAAGRLDKSLQTMNPVANAGRIPVIRKEGADTAAHHESNMYGFADRNWRAHHDREPGTAVAAPSGSIGLRTLAPMQFDFQIDCDSIDFALPCCQHGTRLAFAFASLMIRKRNSAFRAP